MISIKVSDSTGGKISTQHYGINGWKLKPMVIPNCRRCIGIFIFWKTILQDGVIFSITGLHLSPGTPDHARRTRNDILKKLPEQVPDGIPYHAIFCGGAIDTPQNAFYYKNSFRRYIYPFRRKYPDIPMVIYEPTEKTFNTTMFLTKDGDVDVLQKVYQ